MAASDLGEADNQFIDYKLKGEIRVFSINGCPFCKRAKAYLTKKGLSYTELNISDNSSKRKAVIERTGCYTVPQIFFNEKYVGGCDDLMSLNQKDLIEMVEFVRDNEAPPDDLFVLAQVAEEEVTENFEIVCEPDPLLAIAQAMRGPQGVSVKSRQYFFKFYKNVFIGKNAVQWFIDKGHASDVESAINLGNQMMEKHIFHHVKYDHSFKNEELFYRFLVDDQTKSLNVTANDKPVSSCEPIDPANLSTMIRKLILQLYDNHLAEGGLSVNYLAIKEDPLFESYCGLVSELQRIRIWDMGENAKLAFFINIYNSLVIHAQVVKGHPNNTWKRYRFFNVMSYRVGGHDLTLNEIESGILRANRAAPFSLSPPFSAKGDPRRAFALALPEPRIHFALNCGARSCPPIKLYDEAEVQEQLTASAQAFLNESAVEVRMAKKEVVLSKILDWYRVDFGRTDEEVLSWVLAYLTGEKRSQVEELLRGKVFKIVYAPYNWGSNDGK